MDRLVSQLNLWAPRVLSVLRIVAGLLFLQHGLAKHFGFPIAMDMPAGSPPMIAGWIELVAGFLIAIGLFTRPAAFVASGMCAVAYFMVHAPKGFYPLVNGGETVVLYCFAFLYFVFAGGGSLSVDALIRKKA